MPPEKRIQPRAGFFYSGGAGFGVQPQGLGLDFELSATNKKPALAGFYFGGMDSKGGTFGSLNLALLGWYSECDTNLEVVYQKI